jgi:multimeric flavodoxin WrbA
MTEIYFTQSKWRRNPVNKVFINIRRCGLMKVIALNGSPRLVGNTTNLLYEVLDEIEKEGIEVEQIQLYSYDFDPCNDCRSCEMRGDGRCVIEDGLNEVVEKLREADGIILASPGYYGACSGHMKIFLERAGLPVEMGGMLLKRKVGGAIAISLHDGGDATYSQLVGWMLRNEMIVVGGRPTPVIKAANSPHDDEAGVKGAIAMAREMAWTILRLNGLN